MAKAKEKKKLPHGRPTKYRKEFDAIIKRELSSGYTLEACAPSLKISPDRIFEWSNPENTTFQPSFLEAIKEGKAACAKHFNDIGDRLMETGKGSAAVWIFQMKNRFGWADKQEIKHAGEVGVIDLTPDDGEFGDDDDAV